MPRLVNPVGPAALLKGRVAHPEDTLDAIWIANTDLYVGFLMKAGALINGFSLDERPLDRVNAGQPIMFSARDRLL